MSVSKFNNEGYYDPVVYEALTKVEAEERAARAAAAYRPLVYICSPYAGDTQKNTYRARAFSRFAVEKNCIPMAPHLLFPQFIDEATERWLGLKMGIVLLSKCEQVWVLEKSSFSNIEQQSLEFVKYTLDPWVARWEQAMVRALLIQEEKKTYFFKFNVDGLLRGDYQSRMNGYATARQNGWMSANDIRELENLDRIPEEAGGDLYLINGNMTKLADAGIFAAGASESTASESEETQKSRGQPGRTRNKSKAEKVLEHLSAEGFGKDGS